MYNTYMSLEGTDRRIKLNDYNTRLIINMFTSMFDIPEISIETKAIIMRAIAINGHCIVRKVDNNYIVAVGNYVGLPSQTSVFPDEYVAVKTSDPPVQFSGKIKDNESVLYLMYDRLPIDTIFTIADVLTDNDISIRCNVLFSRLAKIATANNEKQRVQYEECLKKMIAGELINTVSTEIDPLTQKAKEIQTSEITSPAYSDRIQYLTMYHNDIVSRICKLFGLRYNFINKRSNITEAELTSCEDYSAVVPLLMLENLKECTKKFGWTIKFSKPWSWLEHLCNEKHSDEVYDNDNSETSIAEDDRGTEDTITDIK